MLANDIERFWSKVDKRGPDECWLWKPIPNNAGYGVFSLQGTSYLAHRIAYELCIGSIPFGVNVCHSCDHSNCCNPIHLFPGTQQDNVDDMIAKGRTRHHIILSNEQVREVRAIYATGQVAIQDLSNWYNVSYATIGNIVRNAARKEA